MLTLTLESVKDYELIDSGEGYKLERFGKYIISRPDPNVLWNKRNSSLWEKADAIFDANKENPSLKFRTNSQREFGSTHWNNKSVREPWVFNFDKINPHTNRISVGVKLYLKLTPFKHVGVFPEQIENWKWFGSLIESVGQVSHDREILDNKPNVLNLFGYTGGATLYAAACGAAVTHVDASKPSVMWARENQKLSGLEKAPIRWIVDDAKKFVAREVKRGVKYDAVIMDPPSFGRDPKGKVFKFEKDVPEILDLVSKALNSKPLFFLINSYSLGYSPTVIKNMLGDILPLEKIECGELQIPEESGGRNLPCGVFARYSDDHR